jgi:hypothetical protein
MTADSRMASGRIVIDGKLAGTAWRVRPGLALSAAHCLRKPLSSEHHARCQIEFPEAGGPIAATAGDGDLDPALDVVLLRLANDDPAAPCLKLARLPWDEVEAELVESKVVAWNGYGYPDAKPDGLGLTGELEDVRERHRRGIQLHCRQGGLGNLKHTSGSAVLHRGHAIAMVIWNPEPLAQKVIFARPVDQIARRFPELEAPLHPRYRPVMPREKRYLSCDRTPQWGRFTASLQPASVRLFFIRGPEHEAPEHFVAGVSTGLPPDRLGSSAPPDWQVRDVRWSADLPASTQPDFLAALSRAVLDEEVPPTELSETLVEMSRSAKLVVIHRLLNISRPIVQRRLDEIYAYYATTLPDLLRPRMPLPADSRGIVFVQPYYWEHRGLAWFSPRASAARDWERRLRELRPDPLHTVIAPDLERITEDHVNEFLIRELPHLGDEQRDEYLHEARLRKTSREVLKFLEEEIR